MFVVRFAVSNALFLVPAYLKIVSVKFQAILNRKLEESIPLRILKFIFFLILGLPLCVAHWFADLLRCVIEALAFRETSPKRLLVHCNKSDAANQEALLESMQKVCKVF